MRIVHIVLGFIKVIFVWPIVILFLLIYFRKPIIDFMGRITRLKSAFGEVNATTPITDIENLQVPILKDKPEIDLNEEKNKLTNIAQEEINQKQSELGFAEAFMANEIYYSYHSNIVPFIDKLLISWPFSMRKDYLRNIDGISKIQLLISKSKIDPKAGNEIIIIAKFVGDFYYNNGDINKMDLSRDDLWLYYKNVRNLILWINNL